MQNVLITTEGIQKNLKRFKPLDAICEYIWNGFDADATRIRVNLHEGQFGFIDMIEIVDNGVGICFDELSSKFQKFNDSSKYRDEQYTTLPKGRRGIGRLTFFLFATDCQWETVYRKEDTNYRYYISMNKDHLNQYDDNGGNQPSKTEDETGTIVRIKQIDTLDKKEIIQKIKDEFFWFLELNKSNGYTIFVDDEEIDYSDYILYKQEIDLSQQGLLHQYDIVFVQWNVKLGTEYSRLYFKDSKGKERYKETTKLNRQADQFYHSVYIKSDYFDDFHWINSAMEGQESLFPNKQDEEYKKLIDYINAFLMQQRKKYLKEASDKYIEGLVENKIYPDFDDSSVVGQYQRQQLNNLVGAIYTAQPKVFSGLNDDNKKILIGMLNLILENGDKPELYNILKQVIELDDIEMRELSNILQYTSLNRISKTIQLLSDRLKVVQTLKEIVFSKDYKTFERHIQSIVEDHYWLFGEQYSLITSAEPDFEQALQGLIKKEQGIDEKVTIDHEDKNKEMDIFMLKQDRQGKITDNVVVELKRPNVRLGSKEVDQIKKYMRVIKSDNRFNAGNVKWTFYLVGNDYDSSQYIEGELESHQVHGKPFLIHTQDKNLTNIFVMRWSEIFDDFSKRYDFLMNKLEFERSLWIEQHENADDAVNSLKDNTAKEAEAVVPKRKA